MNRERLKSIGVDVLGIIAIIGAGLTAPIPGPGGIPLLILGLSLLSTNHEWAARWMEWVKHNGGNLTQKLFSKHQTTRWVIDLLGVLLIAIAVLLVTQFTKSVAWTAAFSMSCLALFLLLGNRERIQSIKSKFRKS